VALDFKAKGDREVVHKLVANSDLVIASYKPGDSEKLGMSYEQLKVFNPQLIYGQITGYGAENDRVGYDAVLQAETGFMDLNGEKDGPPTKMPVALIDVLAAHHLKEGLLLALLRREKTGEGSLVEVSLVQAAVSSLVNQASNWLVAEELPTRQGSSHPNIAPYGDTFLTADGKRILLAIGSDRQFKDLCTVLGIVSVALDKRFATNQKRVENRIELVTVLSKEIEKHRTSELMARIHAVKIPAGIVQNIAEALEMDEARQIMLSSGGLNGIRTFVSSNAPNDTILPPPHFGEHTQEVRRMADL
jgi:crotonobetainyl-CoA:carnitine CoA-transferase CaiB-like acyl-CoA transferase